jgi:radical SAM superfamily enzyme YgiQ (UPF0313 family)
MNGLRIALVSLPKPGRSFINRDLFGGMAIDDQFGTDTGASFVARLKSEGTVIPEIAFPYLGAVLADHDVRFFDGARIAQDSPPAAALQADVVAYAPAWIVASSSFANLGNEVDLLGALGRAAGARTVLFGAAAASFAAEILARPGVDFVVDGEAEAVVPDLVARPDPESVAGVWRRTPRGPEGTGRRLVQDLDALPFPDWSVSPVSRYRYFPLLKRRPFATVQASRGCTYGCAFCPYPAAQGERFRARRPEAVVDEMAHLVERFGVRSILFRDPNFALDRARVVEICQGLIRRKVRVDWGCETRLDLLDDELVGLLAAAGCRSAEVGMDSLSVAASARHGRKTIAPDEARARIRSLDRHGIASAALFLVGLPGDDEASILDTIGFAVGLAPTYLNFEIPVPFPGTALYRDAVRDGRMAALRLDDLRGRTPILAAGSGLDADRLHALQARAVRRFYVRPVRLLRTLRPHPFHSIAFLVAVGARFLWDRWKALWRGGR